LNRFEQNGVIEKGLPTLEVDPFDRANVLSLLQNIPNIPQGQRADLPRAPPDKAVIALEIALIREEQV
jgi:hypothetical protein